MRVQWKKKLRLVIQQILQLLIASFLYLIFIIVMILPWKGAVALGKGVGFLAWFIARGERKKVIERMTLAFGDTCSVAEIREHSKRCFMHLGMSFAETMQIPKLGPSTIRALFDTEGLELLERHLAKGQGVILFGAHIGNWELLGTYLGMNGYPVYVVARDNPNRYINWLIILIRTCAKMHVIIRESGQRNQMIDEVFEHNGFLGLLVDQDSKKMKGVFAPFFGKLAYSPSGPIGLVIRYKKPVYLFTSVRLPDGRHKLRCQGPLLFTQTGDLLQDLTTNVTYVNKLIEDQIRAYPEQWVWVHNRWRTRPEWERKGG